MLPGLSYEWVIDGWFIHLLLNPPGGAETSPSDATCHCFAPYNRCHVNWTTWFSGPGEKLLKPHVGKSSETQKCEEAKGNTGKKLCIETSRPAKVCIDHHWKAQKSQRRLCRHISIVLPVHARATSFFVNIWLSPLPFIDKTNIENVNIYFQFFFSYPCLPLSW